MTPVPHQIRTTFPPLSFTSEPNAVRRGASLSRGIMKGLKGCGAESLTATHGNGVQKA